MQYLQLSSRYEKVFQRWLQSESQNETQMLKLQQTFRRYKLNIYFLQKAALKIQHWFFKRRFSNNQNLESGPGESQNLIEKFSPFKLETVKGANFPHVISQHSSPPIMMMTQQQQSSSTDGNESPLYDQTLYYFLIANNFYVPTVKSFLYLDNEAYESNQPRNNPPQPIAQSVRARLAVLVGKGDIGIAEENNLSDSQRLFRFSEAMASAERSVNIMTERSLSRDRVIRDIIGENHHFIETIGSSCTKQKEEVKLYTPVQIEKVDNEEIDAIRKIGKATRKKMVIEYFKNKRDTSNTSSCKRKEANLNQPQFITQSITPLALNKIAKAINTAKVSASGSPRNDILQLHQAFTERQTSGPCISQSIDFGTSLGIGNSTQRNSEQASKQESTQKKAGLKRQSTTPSITAQGKQSQYLKGLMHQYLKGTVNSKIKQQQPIQDSKFQARSKSPLLINTERSTTSALSTIQATVAQHKLQNTASTTSLQKQLKILQAFEQQTTLNSQVSEIDRSQVHMPSTPIAAKVVHQQKLARSKERIQAIVNFREKLPVNKRVSLGSQKEEKKK